VEYFIHLISIFLAAFASDNIEITFGKRAMLKIYPSHPLSHISFEMVAN